MGAINKEIENLKVAFHVLDDEFKAPVGCNKSSGHFLFDARMPLERKTRWAKDRHEAPETKWSTFVGVISRERALALN